MRSNNQLEFARSVKQASRFMSKPVRESLSLAGWGVLSVLAVGLLVLLWRHPLATAFSIAVLAGVTWFDFRSSRNICAHSLQADRANPYAHSPVRWIAETWIHGSCVRCMKRFKII